MVLERGYERTACQRVRVLLVYFMQLFNLMPVSLTLMIWEVNFR